MSAPPTFAPADIANSRGIEPSQLLLSDELLRWADRHRWWLWGTVLLCYIAAFNGQWRVQSDAALYLSIGRNVAQGKGFTYLGRPNALAYPGWPLLIAGVFRVFGSDALPAVNATMTIIALMTVALVYRLFLIHSGRPTAVVVSVGVGLTKAFFCYGFELWSDMPFAMGVMAFLAGCEGAIESPQRPVSLLPGSVRRTADWALLVGGLLTAISMRPTGWPLLLALVVTLVANTCRGCFRGSSLLSLCAGGAVVVGAFVLVSRGMHQTFGDVYARFVINRFTGQSLPGLVAVVISNAASLFSWAASDVLFQVRLGPYLNALLSGVVVLLGISLFRFRLLWGLWFCLLLGTILVAQETLDRYFLPVLPLLVFAWWQAIVRINRIGPRGWSNLVFLGLLGFGAAMNVSKVGGIVIQQRSSPFLLYYDKGTYEAIPEFARRTQDVVPPNGIIYGRSPYTRVTAFLSRRCVTNPIEDPIATAHGRPIFIMEPIDEPNKLKMNALLERAGLSEGPALFTVAPTQGHDPQQPTLSLHATFK